MPHWAMVIDLNACIGCKACVLACSQANGVPEGMWRKLIVFSDCPPPERKRLLATRACMHCADPPCKDVCPTGATYQREDGIVAVDGLKCVGCGYCILACPYDARTIHRYRHTFEAEGVAGGNPGNPVNAGREGICTKCDFCKDRIDNGSKNGLVPGVDPDATPYCVVTCSSGVLHFGDLDDPQSKVSELLQSRKVFRLFTGVETEPSVYYLAE